VTKPALALRHQHASLLVPPRPLANVVAAAQERNQAGTARLTAARAGRLAIRKRSGRTGVGAIRVSPSSGYVVGIQTTSPSPMSPQSSRGRINTSVSGELVSRIRTPACFQLMIPATPGRPRRKPLAAVLKMGAHCRSRPSPVAARDRHRRCLVLACSRGPVACAAARSLCAEFTRVAETASCRDTDHVGKYRFPWPARPRQVKGKSWGLRLHPSMRHLLRGWGNRPRPKRRRRGAPDCAVVPPPGRRFRLRC